MLGAILIILLVFMLLGVLPIRGHSRSREHGPSGTIGLILAILIAMVLTGRPRPAPVIQTPSRDSEAQGWRPPRLVRPMALSADAPNCPPR